MPALKKKTDQHLQTETAFRDSAQAFRLLFENSPEAAFLFDGRAFIDCNPAAVHMAACSCKEDLLGLGPGDWAPERQPDGASSIQKAFEYIDLAFRHGSMRFEWLGRRKTGEEFLAEVQLTSIPISGRRVLYVICRDLTERKLLEAQLRQAQKLEAIGTLAGGISHDFNNILASIIGYTEIALQKKLSPDSPARHSMEQVLKGAHRAKNLVKQILAFSRQEEQGQKPLQTALIVKEALKLLRASLPSTIRIHEQIDDPEGCVLGDVTQVHQVLMNLCTNAFHAMREKGGDLTVGLKEAAFNQRGVPTCPDLNPGIYQELSVADTGNGMEPAILERIFDPFFTTKKPGEGTGLGLSTVYGIVKGHGGAISVESRVGHGSAFRVYLPRVTPQAATADVTSMLLPRGTERILFVDDEEFIVEMSLERLRFLGYDVTVRTDPLEALKDFSLHPEGFDLVMTDQTMPDLTGIDLAKQILLIRPDIPIILFTGFSELVTPAKVKAAGIREFVMKPLVIQDLAVLIRRVFDGEG